MSVITTLLRAVLPVGSARRDALLGLFRRAGVIPPAPESSYQRWIQAFEDSTPVAPATTTAASSIAFRVTVHPGSTSPAALTRTLVSLINQSHPRWTAVMPMPDSFGPAARRVLADAVAAEPRFTTRPVWPPVEQSSVAYTVELSVGDALSPDALALLAAAADRHLGAGAITAEFDMIDPFSGRRSAPASVGPWEPDLAAQFDLDSGFVAHRVDAVRPVGQGAVPHVDSIVMHRLVGPRARATSLLRPAPTIDGAAASPRRNGGTRLRHRVIPGTTVAVFVRDPLADRVAAQRRLDRLMHTAGTQAEVVHIGTWTSGEAMPTAGSADVVAVVDGGLTPSEDGWLDDLIGALQQPHVFAVAPVLAVPSGVVFDGGVVCGDHTLRARSGRADLAPFELERCRQVHSLSGRALVVRVDDWSAIVARHDGADGADGLDITAALADAAAQARRCCLVWAHQRWVLDAGIDAGPSASPMLAWTTGRLRSWFDPDVEPHRPEPGRSGEGVW